MHLDEHACRLGDLVYVKLTVKNAGKEALVIPRTFTRNLGTLRFELYDRDAYLYRFQPDGAGWGEVGESPLKAGRTRLIYDCLRLPRCDQLDHDFWKPAGYELTASIRVGTRWFHSGAHPIALQGRSQEELAAIKEFYDGGIFKHRRPPADWGIHGPSLGWFGLGTFPTHVNTTEKLTEFEAKLSPGTLRNVVHLTRLAQAVYDAKATAEKREATTELFAWLDSMPDVEREWLALKLVSWSLQNKGLGEFSFEFTDQVIPRLPDQCGDRNPQEYYRKENQYLRQSYLKYLQESTPGHRPAGD
jgi:hypothetical protein